MQLEASKMVFFNGHADSLREKEREIILMAFSIDNPPLLVVVLGSRY
jgi:hypothetical protein